MARRTVYVVDDEEPVRRALKMMLSVSGYAVTTFDSGASLLKVAEALEPGAVLLDIRMPDMDGIEVQGHLVARGIALPIIVMTGHGDLAVASSALRRGAVAFLEKPFAKATLVSALDDAFLKLEEPEAYEGQLAAAAAAVHSLGEEDRGLLASLAAGLSNEEIATDLGVGTAVVEVRRARLFSQLGVDTLNEALRMACSAGLRDFT
ncbi:MAG TPA: response regulator [Allosphingosinicella sp.]|nr:response regulator [Allosphingosinicella sp.]